ELQGVGELEADLREAGVALDLAVIDPAVLARQRRQRIVAARDHAAEEVLADEAVDLRDVVLLQVHAADPVEAAVGIVRREAELLAELVDVRILADRLREQELTIVRSRRPRAVSGV